MVNGAGQPIPWEACITLNNHWGYIAQDRDYKSAEQVIHALVECVSKGGNLLLNVGPNAKGEIPQESLDILREVGSWMRANGDSIYRCGPSFLSKPEWGRYTQHENLVYAHIYDRGIGPINFRNLGGKIESARLLADGAEIKIDKPWNAHDYAQDAFIQLNGQKLPDARDTVVALKLK